MLRSSLPAIVALAMVPSSLQAQNHQHSSQSSPYAGFESRKIKSLSDEDITELRKGGGWGLALPAELNGVPGPSHLLTLKNEIGLSATQVSKIEAIFSEMKAEAIVSGGRFIAAEEVIENAFAGGELDERRLRVLIDKAAAARADLRFVHLSRHLLTPTLLTKEQIEKYKALRGYLSASSSNTPESHGADMEKSHHEFD